MSTRVIYCCALSLALLVCAGCNSQSGQTVAGTITLDGAPLSQGRITLVPLDKGPSGGGAVVDGEYSLQLNLDSLPARYSVQISSIQPTGKLIKHPDGPGGELEETREVIPSRYNSASELTIELTTDQPEPFDFNLVTSN